MGGSGFKIRRKSSLIISFLVLPVSLVGFSMVIAAGTKLVDFWLSANWVKVPAEIHRLEMKAYKDSDSTMYSVKIQYSYNYNGIAYTSQRFNVSSPGGDTLIYSSAEKEIKRSDPPYCFVNPGNPSEAALVRQIPPRLAGQIASGLFIIVFIFWWSIGVMRSYMEDEYQKKGSFSFIEKLRLIREKPHFPFPVLLLLTCFILGALDFILLSPILGPELAVYLTLGVILVVLMMGLSGKSPRFRKKVQNGLSFIKGFLPVKTQLHRKKAKEKGFNLRIMSIKSGWSIFMLIFVSPFVFFGFKIFLMGMNHFVGVNKAANWVKVPAEILRLEYKSKKSIDNSRDLVESEYVYTYNGVNYTGKRFELYYSESSWDSKTYPELVAEVKSRKPAYCFVNPNNPSEAVLIMKADHVAVMTASFGLFAILFALTGGTWNILKNMGMKRKTKVIYLSKYEIASPYILLSVLPCGASLVMLFLNLFLPLNPETLFYLTLGVIPLAFIAAVVIVSRYSGK